MTVVELEVFDLRLILVGAMTPQQRVWCKRWCISFAGPLAFITCGQRVMR